jgi:two-component system, NarL family, nitrate/nitrite response regulator NarL
MGGAVIVVDDHPVIHEVLRAVARAAYPGATVHLEQTLLDALAKARAVRRLALVLLDLGLPGCAGIEALMRFRETLPAARVAIVSASAEGMTVRAALRAGAVGYLPKTLPPRTMVAALRLVAAGGTYVPPEALADLPLGEQRDGGAPALTGRQAEILSLLARGMPNRRIARQLGIAENTVKQHAHAVFQLLHVANRTEAALAAERLRIRAE